MRIHGNGLGLLLVTLQASIFAEAIITASPPLAAFANGTATTSPSLTAVPSDTSAPSGYNISDTAATNISSSAVDSCSRCHVYPIYDFPQGPGLVRVSWYSGEVSLTLATVSILLTQYDNYTVTRTTTIQNDVNTLNVSTISEVVSLASSILDVGGGNNDYPGLGGGVILANGTDGTITAGGSTSIPYPTPYLKIDAFNLYIPTTSPLSGCEVTPGNGNPFWATSTLVTLSNYYYSAITPAKFISGNSDVENIFQFDNSSLSKFLASDTALMNAYPELKTCLYLPVGFGPPAVKMSVSALTATTTATVKGSSVSTTQSPQPASSITHSAPASTVSTAPLLTTLPSPEVSSQVSKNVPQQTPATSQASSQDEDSSSQISQQSPVANQDSSSGEYTTNQVSTSDYTPGGSPQQNSKITSGHSGGVETTSLPQQGTSKQTLESQTQAQSSAAPAIPFHGSTIQADSSSQYNLPGVGNISPGGEPVTTDNVVYSLAPSATAIISNGNTIALTPVLGSEESARQNAVLTFAGSAYSLDSSSNFIIAGQTLHAGSEAITVSNTPVSLVPGASIAVIGSSTQSLKSGPEQTGAPIITYGGSTYTASSSAFAVGSQKLTPGGQITVSGTPISLASDASVAVIGGSTQSLSYAMTSTAPLEQDRILSFDGSTIAADRSSGFVIAGQTLAPGGKITVSGTPISLGSGATIAVVGSTSTQQLGISTPTDQGRLLIFAGSTFTADGSSVFTIAGQTLGPGGVITISGTPISLGPSASIAVVGGSTQQLANPTPTDQGHLLAFAGSTFTADGTSGLTIAGQTLSPGGVITVSGTPISLGPSATIAVIGSSTQVLASAKGTENAPIISFGGSTYAADTNSDFIIAGQTLTPGGVITVSGTPISLGPSATVAVIGSSTEILVPTEETQTAKIIFGGSTYAADTNSDFVIAGQTLTPGGVITVSGTPISLDPSATVAIIGSSTETLGSTKGTETTKLINFGGSIYTADAASDFIIAGQTLTPGGVITVAGTPISLDSGASIAVIGSSTETLASATTAVEKITFGGSTYTADAASDFVIAGQTLTPGGVITVSGTPISLDSGASIAIIGSSTETLAPATKAVEKITFGGSTYTADAASDFIVAGQTLTPGGVITVSGTTISYGSSGLDVVVGGTTESVMGLASYIVNGFGPASTSIGNGSEPFLGLADATPVPRKLMLLGFFGVGCLLAVYV
ncbi:MAG: hypothetical protein Q9195_008869 [Heterodermia aff. obscurata]